MAADGVAGTQADGINAWGNGERSEQAREAIRALEALLECAQPPSDAEQLEALETQIVRQTDRVAGLIIAVHVQAAVNDPRTAEQSAELVRGRAAQSTFRGRG
jgi:hypothetical protein